MDQSRSQSEPPQAQHRDMMYCHSCNDEWYRDQHGLSCPECGSDFTEIIEANNDPRDDPALAHAHGHDHPFDDDDEDDDDDMPALEEAPAFVPNPNERNPWREHNDPSEADLSNLQWRQVGPGRFAVTGTMYRTVSPDEFARSAGAGGLHGPDAMGGFASLLNSIVGGMGGGLGGNGAPQPPPGQQDAQNASGQGNARSGSGTTPDGHRFTYTAGARLYPRDAENPGPRMEPVDDLNNLLVGLMAAFGEAPGAHRGPDHPLFGMPEGHQMPGHGMNPLLQMMFQHIMPGGQHGDAVYSQEAMDRIVTQLMEQNATSNAPGPATQTDIESLPRKPVTIDMLGDDGRADCSICMDEVNIGEEVAELPCHHWFHHQCISAWLGEHDTCPHCRVGISKHDAQNPSQAGNNHNGASGGASPSRNMPGAFGGAVGEGISIDPFGFPASPSSNQRDHASPDAGDRPQSADGGSGGGIGERIRRGLFGSPR
ncbi:hypothetical protein K491DRAFT_608127 [Lophiostoma macrostomum CBS 122681]|uniref:RING-type E3 ubiquitin transferase n=1 Tax=Lophiostoma macrostomum CBS 122681 TaxID=1314788 RepID=A0A6A6STC7_9PLEO|nr:hypothetical protein K491DRAFT_608127 [Lophiostoma macrostomum CBS 122681]